MSLENKPLKNRSLDFSIIEKLFFRPQLEDPNKQRIAQITHILSTIILLLGFVIILLSPLMFSKLIFGISITTTIIIVMFLVQILNKKGKIGIAAHIFVYFIWIMDTVIILFSGGYHSEYLPAYVAVTAMGGLILGGFSAFHFGGLSLFAYLIFYYLDSQGLMIDPLITFNHTSLFFVFFANILMSAFVLILVIRKYEDTFEQLIDNEQSLYRTNLELTWEIEAREQAEVYLTQSEERFRSAVMDSPYPTLLYAEDGEILSLNEAWKDKSGYSQDDVSSISDLYNHIFRNESFTVTEELKKLTTGLQTRTEGYFTIFTRLGESKKWYFHWTVLPDLPDSRCHILTIAADMTNMVDIESALRKSEEDLSKLALVTNDGIWDWDLLTDQVNFDPRYYTMAGYEVDEFPHHLDEFRKRVHPDDLENVFNLAESHLSGEIDHFNAEFRFKTKEGSWLWILGRGKITEQDENGNPLRFVGTHTDISDRKLAEEKLIQYRQQLEEVVDDRTQKLEERISEVEKLNAALSNILDDYQIANEKLSRVSSNLTETNQEMESLTYIVSNDLRDPLQEIIRISEEIQNQQNKKVDEIYLDQLKEINQYAIQMENLVNNLLNLSLIGQEELNLEKVSPNKIVEEVLSAFSEEIEERKINITVNDLPACQADRDQLTTLFVNLISNAIKFTDKKKQPEIIIGYQPDESKKRVVYFVKDNGIGFSKKDQEKVFETFQRLHDQEEYKGAGFGLAHVKKIVNKHGGQIWVEAKKNRGATFYFDLASI